MAARQGLGSRLKVSGIGRDRAPACHPLKWPLRCRGGNLASDRVKVWHAQRL